MDTQGSMGLMRLAFAVARAPHAWVRQLIRLREKRPLSFSAVFTIVAFVSAARIGLELSSARLPHSYSPTAILNVICFYLLAAELYTLVGVLLTGRDPRVVVSVVTVGIFLGVLPPIVDLLVGGVGTGHYRYVPADHWQWSLLNTEFYSIGETAVLWATIAFMAAYVAETTRSVLSTIVAAMGAYAVVAILATAGDVGTHLARFLVPALDWVGGLREPRRAPGIGSLAFLAVQLALAQLAYLAARPRLAWHLLRRSVHALPFLALVFLGAAVGRELSERGPGPAVTVRLTVCFAALLFGLCLTALAQNDAFDAKEDRRPESLAVCRDDAQFFTVTGALTVVSVLSVLEYAGFALAVFFIASIAYSFDFYRAKRYFPSNYKVEGAWAWAAFVLGVYSRHPMHVPLPASVLAVSFCVFGGWSIFNAFKDYKDIRRDVHAGNQTLYVLAWRRGIRLRRLHLALRAALSACLVAAPLPLVLRGYGAAFLLVLAVGTAAPVCWALGRSPSKRSVHAFLLAITAYLAVWAAIIEAT